MCVREKDECEKTLDLMSLLMEDFRKHSMVNGKIDPSLADEWFDDLFTRVLLMLRKEGYKVRKFLYESSL